MQGQVKQLFLNMEPGCSKTFHKKFPFLGWLANTHKFLFNQLNFQELPPVR